MQTDPSLTTTGVLPRAEPSFKGKIERSYEQSTPDFPQPYRAPTGTPNVLLIMTDDVGFGASSTFGGPIPTPTFDGLAERGIRYNRFHTTALCSPTRAALITGRNPHNANTGIIMERSLGFPGYNSVMSKSCGTVAEVLRQNGFNTAWFGKNHNVPDWQTSLAGPFDLWPTGLGFEHFLGFLGGDCNQWAPAAFEGTTPIEPQLGKSDYHFDVDMADRAVRWIEQQHSLDPDKPFFLYYAPGATHAPHHVPKAWIEQFKGKFDHGWDEQREITFATQKRLGIIPQEAQLTPRPANLPSWDSQSPRQRELFARMMEIYAAYLAFSDHNIGRVIDAVIRTGQLDNTLIIYIQGDNGGSGEGTLQGTANELAIIGNGESEPFEYLYSVKDELGGPLHYNHFPVPWSWAMNSPMQWMKRYGSHFGGTRNGMVMSWPNGIKDAGSQRGQFHHVIDIVPTIYEVMGITPPEQLNGVTQKPIDGVSMAYTWHNAEAPEERTTQYFEMFANRAIYHEGWIACTTPLVFPWEPEPKGLTPDSFAWELYDLTTDFSEYRNLASEHPEKLKTLQALFWAEAKKYQVLPINTSVQATIDAAPTRPSLTKGRRRFEYFPGTVRIPEGTAPNTKNTSYKITAEIVVPPEGANGVIVTQGGRFAGWGLFVLDGKPVWAYKRTQQPKDGFRIEGPARLAPGAHTVSVDFAYAGGGFGKGGTFTLRVDGRPVASGEVTRTVPARFSVDETLDIGEDTGTPIVESYAAKMPFRFTGEIKKVAIELDPGHPRDGDAQVMRDLERRALHATE